MDTLNRYSLTEMEDRVYRALKQKQATISTAGVESGVIVQTQSFSTVDIDQQLNKALVAVFTEIVLEREDQFSQTFYVSIGNNNAGPYAFPPQLLQLRYMDWIDPGIGQANARPEQWVPMNYMDDPMNRQMSRDFRGPTWKYDLSGAGFMLNSLPTQDNPSGVRVTAVVMPPPLVKTDDVIKARFATVMQEVVILDAAIALGKPRNMPAVGALMEDRQEWHQRLVSTAANAHHPPSTITLSGRLPSMSYSGRRRGRSRW